MSEWDKLEDIVLKWGKILPEPESIQKMLDDVSTVYVNKLTKELRKGIWSKDSQQVELFGQLFEIARRAVEIELKHPQIDSLIKYCRDLLDSGFYLPETINFLQIVLDQYATVKADAAQVNAAFDALLAGINNDNEELANVCMQILSFMTPRLNKFQRNRLINQVKKLSIKYLKASLIPTLERYCELIDRAEKAVRESKWKVDSPSSVISVHSHKGGVGKTMFSIALAAELASNRKKVCLIDCDDEGPSLFHSIPVDWEKDNDIMFLVNWYDSRIKEIPNEMIPTFNFKGGEISCIPGSYLASDVARLDYRQRGRRPSRSDYKQGQYKIFNLIRYLIEEKKFNHVIIDTGPGIAHLTLDVLLANLSVNGSLVFIMRPRVVDISQFCIDMDWLWWLREKRMEIASAIVLNFAVSRKDKTHINLMDGNELATKMESSQQFQIFSHLYFKHVDSGPLLKDLIKKTWNEYKGRIHLIPDIWELRHADSLDNPSDASIFEIVCELPSVRNKAKAVLESLSQVKII